MAVFYERQWTTFNLYMFLKCVLNDNAIGIFIVKWKSHFKFLNSRIITLPPYPHHTMIKAQERKEEKKKQQHEQSVLDLNLALSNTHTAPIHQIRLMLNRNLCWWVLDSLWMWRIRAVNKRDISKLRWCAVFIYDSIYSAIIFWVTDASFARYSAYIDLRTC